MIGTANFHCLRGIGKTNFEAIGFLIHIQNKQKFIAVGKSPEDHLNVFPVLAS